MTPRKIKTQNPTFFRFTCKLKSKFQNVAELSSEHADPNIALHGLCNKVAKAAQDGFAVDSATATIFATREFIQTFKPSEGGQG